MIWVKASHNKDYQIVCMNKNTKKMLPIFPSDKKGEYAIRSKSMNKFFYNFVKKTFSFYSLESCLYSAHFSLWDFKCDLLMSTLKGLGKYLIFSVTFLFQVHAAAAIFWLSLLKAKQNFHCCELKSSVLAALDKISKPYSSSRASTNSVSLCFVIWKSKSQ